MRATSRRMHYTYAEYLFLEEESPIRHEYLDGEIYAMAGGTPDHAALAGSIIGILGRLSPQCRVSTSNLRVHTPTGLTTYPDATVIYGPTQRAADDRNAVTNPLILVEITSASTEDYDRGDKLRHYQSIPTLREVVIVSHREPRITLHHRDERGWSSEEAVAGGEVPLASIGAVVRVDDVYRAGLEDA
ncbi:MAG TPA: Uma2 family endonuclease [Thermoanaerobaculia bacterium]|nr:Uma2 family endonuclease [Thermoanaerobaculia bacterium]